jgi:hypothetical protein
MKYLRIIDQVGNKEDVEAEFVPRIGERIVRTFRVGQEPMTDHYFRVRDVEYWFDNKLEHQARILIEEEDDGIAWPS